MSAIFKTKLCDFMTKCAILKLKSTYTLKGFSDPDPDPYSKLKITDLHQTDTVNSDLDPTKSFGSELIRIRNTDFKSERRYIVSEFNSRCFLWRRRLVKINFILTAAHFARLNVEIVLKSTCNFA